MRINTNVSSLTAQEAATNTNYNIKNSLEKLSTGLKINKASDDASGLAIADKLRTQVTSINQGVANGNSAISLLQIADKSMAEQSNILDTVKAKLIQANTATTSDDGRESIRKDISKLLEQLDNIAKQTNYNGTKLLEGKEQARSIDLNFQIGETENDMITKGAIQANTKGLGGAAKDIATGTNIKQNETIKVKDTDAAGSITVSGSKPDTKAGEGALNEKTNVELSGVLGKVTATGANGTIITNDKATIDALDTMVKNSVAGLTGVKGSYTLEGGKAVDFGNLNVSLSISQAGADANSIKIETKETVSITNLEETELDIKGDNLKGGEALSKLKNLEPDKLTMEVAADFQEIVNTAITELNGYRGDIGSTQNQVESAVRNLMTQSTNIKAAESIIRDVDYAQESANFNKLNIISQAGSYAISQANAAQQNVLRLLQ